MMLVLESICNREIDCTETTINQVCLQTHIKALAVSSK